MMDKWLQKQHRREREMKDYGVVLKLVICCFRRTKTYNTKIKYNRSKSYPWCLSPVCLVMTFCGINVDVCVRNRQPAGVCVDSAACLHRAAHL